MEKARLFPSLICFVSSSRRFALLCFEISGSLRNIEKRFREFFRFSVMKDVEVRDFTSSWRDGLAFNALIYAIKPGIVDIHRVQQMDIQTRLEHAFLTAEQQLGIPRLIDPEGFRPTDKTTTTRNGFLSIFFSDVNVAKPDEKSIMTYLAQFSRRYPDLVSFWRRIFATNKQTFENVISLLKTACCYSFEKYFRLKSVQLEIGSLTTESFS